MEHLRKTFAEIIDKPKYFNAKPHTPLRKNDILTCCVVKLDLKHFSLLTFLTFITTLAVFSIRRLSFVYAVLVLVEFSRVLYQCFLDNP